MSLSPGNPWRAYERIKERTGRRRVGERGERGAGTGTGHGWYINPHRVWSGWKSSCKAFGDSRQSKPESTPKLSSKHLRCQNGPSRWRFAHVVALASSARRPRAAATEGTTPPTSLHLRSPQEQNLAWCSLFRQSSAAVKRGALAVNLSIFPKPFRRALCLRCRSCCVESSKDDPW